MDNYNKFNTILQAKILRTKKAFLFYDLDDQGNVSNYRFSNNHKLDSRNLYFNHYYVISCIRPQIKNNLLETFKLA